MPCRNWTTPEEPVKKHESESFPTLLLSLLAFNLYPLDHGSKLIAVHTKF